jgi:hypothetical protein
MKSASNQHQGPPDFKPCCIKVIVKKREYNVIKSIKNFINCKEFETNSLLKAASQNLIVKKSGLRTEKLPASLNSTKVFQSYNQITKRTPATANFFFNKHKLSMSSKSSAKTTLRFYNTYKKHKEFKLNIDESINFLINTKKYLRNSILT